MSVSGLDTLPARTEGETRAAIDMRERAAHLVDRMGDAKFTELASKGASMANLVQGHYLRCAAGIRNLPLTGEVPGTSAGTKICDALSDLIDGLQDMRRRKVIDEAVDDQWLDAKIETGIAALKLMGRI